MKTITIADEFTVNRIGLGTNRIVNNEESKQALLKAVETGINFIDTAEAYTNNASETTIGETLFPYQKGLVIATKGGMSVPDFHVDGRVETLKKQLEGSLNRLKVDTIDLYFLHKVDPNVPLSESIRFLKQMQEQGKIRHVGLSNVSIEQIEEAKKLVNIVAVENEYNLSVRKHDDVLDYCEKNGIVFIPFYPLHSKIPEDNDVIVRLKQKYNVTSPQLSLAWLLARSKVMLPIPGSLSPRHLEENVKALDIELTEEDFNELTNIV